MPQLVAPAVVIRHARKDEVEPVVAVIRAAYAQFSGDLPRWLFDAYMATLDGVPKEWAEAEVLVAELDGRIVGTIWFYRDASAEGLGLPGEWSGFRFFSVLPEARGHAIGRKLLDRCIEISREIGVTMFSVHTSAFMTAARHMYETMGFRRFPQYDFSAADMLGFNPADGDSQVLAYALPLDTPAGSSDLTDRRATAPSH